MKYGFHFQVKRWHDWAFALGCLIEGYLVKHWTYTELNQVTMDASTLVTASWVSGGITTGVAWRLWREVSKTARK